MNKITKPAFSVYKSLLAVFGFFTRIPIRTNIAYPLGQAAWAFPIAGLVLGGITGSILVIAGHYVPFWLAAWLAILAYLLLSGGLHEDGLADSADGFLLPKAKRLAAMHDSHIGVYGVLALLIFLAMRAGIYSELGQKITNPIELIAGFAAIYAASRAGAAILIAELATLEESSLLKSIGVISRRQAVLALILAIGLLLLSLPTAKASIIITGFLIVIFLSVVLLQKHFGGISGDIVGAMIIILEMILLIIWFV